MGRPAGKERIHLTPADDAAYAALDLEPGRPWHEVHDAWRQLVKRHHPDRNHLAGKADLRRLHEVNAAYRQLRTSAAPVVPEPGEPERLSHRRSGDADRRELWDRIWDAREWATWMPGATSASSIAGMSDRRASVQGRWSGRRWSAVLVFSDVTPCLRLCARVLELRIGGEIVELGAPPRVYVSMSADDGGRTAVEIGISWRPPDGALDAAPLATALELAVCRLLGIAAVAELQAPRDDEGRWAQAA